MNDENIKDHEFKPGQSGNPSGKPPGTKNRSTIARKVLGMKGIFTDQRFDKLKKEFPEITKQSTVEEIMTIVQAGNASAGDEKAYKNLMDSAYGAPKQEIDQSVTGQINLIIQAEDAKLGE